MTSAHRNFIIRSTALIAAVVRTTCLEERSGTMRRIFVLLGVVIAIAAAGCGDADVDYGGSGGSERNECRFNPDPYCSGGGNERSPYEIQEDFEKQKAEENARRGGRVP